MAKHYNPQTNGTLEKSKQMYAEIGLCYECGRQLELCSCELGAEELTKRANCQTCMISKDLRHCEDCAFKAYKYLHVGEQVALAYGVSDLSLNDMTPEQQNEWFSSVPEVEL